MMYDEELIDERNQIIVDLYAKKKTVIEALRDLQNIYYKAKANEFNELVKFFQQDINRIKDLRFRKVIVGVTIQELENEIFDELYNILDKYEEDAEITASKLAKKFVERLIISLSGIKI